MSHKKNKKKTEIKEGGFYRGVAYLNLYVYLGLMLGVLPLFVEEQYVEMGTLKYIFFRNSSLIYLAVCLVFGAAFFFHRHLGRKGGASPPAGRQCCGILTLSFLDRAVLSYGLCVLLSFWFSQYREFALEGAEGWRMGLYTQLMLVALYLALSRTGGGKTMIKPVLGIHFLSSLAVFLLGFLHRFNVDPLGMYQGLSETQKQLFLSTMGQATWYSSYLCTVVGLGIGAFFLSRGILPVLASGIYLALAFATLVTQNSDSAFVALAVMLLLSGRFALEDSGRVERFFWLMVLLWGTFGGVGILQRVFSDRAISLGSLSLWFSQSPFTWLFTGFFLLCVFFWRRLSGEGRESWRLVLKKLCRRFWLIPAAGLALLLLFIYLNTCGYLLDWFGYQTKEAYLFFDDSWGNNRGLSWTLAWQAFWDLPLLNKLFGVGPDCFLAHLYAVPETAERLRSFWGDLGLGNAHNEYLNSLLCYGILGLAAWLAALIGGVRYFDKKSIKQPAFIGVALCIASYSAHNFFCYQQVLCTPFLFLIMGVGEGAARERHTVLTSVQDGYILSRGNKSKPSAMGYEKPGKHVHSRWRGLAEAKERATGTGRKQRRREKSDGGEQEK